MGRAPPPGPTPSRRARCAECGARRLPRPRRRSSFGATLPPWCGRRSSHGGRRSLDREIGKDYYGVLIGPTLKSQARRVVGRFRPEEIYSTQRELIEKQIREGIDTAIKGRHIELEAVLIRNVSLPPTIQAAINDKLEKEQAALKMKYVEEEQKAQDRVKLMQANDGAEQQKIVAQSAAETAKMQARSAAEVTRISAQASADAKRVEGQGLADYQKTIQRTITPEILRMREIEASKALAESPNTTLVLGAGSAHTLIDMRGAGGGGGNPYP